MESNLDRTTRSLNVTLTEEDIQTLLDGGTIEDVSRTPHVVASLQPETGQDTAQVEPEDSDRNDLNRQLGASTSKAIVLLDKNTRREIVEISIAESFLRNAVTVHAEPLFGSDIATQVPYSPVHSVRIELPGGYTIDDFIAKKK
jgi:hypothetical protein